MSQFDRHVTQIEDILGVKVSDGVIQFTVKVDTDCPIARKRGLADIRLKQKALRAVKRDISSSISEIKRDYQTRNATVGTGVGSFIVTVFLGARFVGRQNSLTRADMRNDKAADVQPYEGLKDVVDNLLYELDCAKAKIA